jgi:uncharacterized protein (DUF1499 family)
MNFRAFAFVPWLATGLAVLAGLVQASAGLGWKQGWWALPTSFEILRWTAYVAFPCLAASAVGAVVAGWRKGWRLALVSTAGIAVSAGVLIVPLDFNARRQLPPINDIATDTADPPAFVKYPLSERGAQSQTYAGAAFADQQKKAYPDLAPLGLKLEGLAALARAIDVATAAGLTIVEVREEKGLVQATATTPWFGFTDDVIIRVSPMAGGSRIDIRSKSRVGRSDLGANAFRIRKLLAAFKAKDCCLEISP